MCVVPWGKVLAFTLAIGQHNHFYWLYMIKVHSLIVPSKSLLFKKQWYTVHIYLRSSCFVIIQWIWVFRSSHIHEDGWMLQWALCFTAQRYSDMDIVSSCSRHGHEIYLFFLLTWIRLRSFSEITMTMFTCTVSCVFWSIFSLKPFSSLDV